MLPDTAVARRNRTNIAAANTAGFTINLSAKNPAEADAFADHGIAPVVTIVAHEYVRQAIRHWSKNRPDEWAETVAKWHERIARLPRHTPAGRRIAICPPTYTSATCQSCGACAEARNAVIAFPGARHTLAKGRKVTAARDVPPGTSWPFLDHRTMAQVITVSA